MNETVMEQCNKGVGRINGYQGIKERGMSLQGEKQNVDKSKAGEVRFGGRAEVCHMGCLDSLCRTTCRRVAPSTRAGLRTHLQAGKSTGCQALCQSKYS